MVAVVIVETLADVGVGPVPAVVVAIAVVVVMGSAMYDNIGQLA